MDALTVGIEEDPRGVEDRSKQCEGVAHESEQQSLDQQFSSPHALRRDGLAGLVNHVQLEQRLARRLAISRCEPHPIEPEREEQEEEQIEEFAGEAEQIWGGVIA